MTIKYPVAPQRQNNPIEGTPAQALANIAYLWQTDDVAWMEQRTNDWAVLARTGFDDYPKSSKKVLERYFKYGEKTTKMSAGGIFGEQTVYMPVGDFFLLTPFDSPESLMQLFNSRLLDYNDRRDITSSYLFGDKCFEHCHWFEHHTMLIINTILGDSYYKVVEQTSTHHIDVISQEPTYWCKDFVYASIKSINENVEWRPFYHCIDYFISALTFALYDHHRKGIKLPELLLLFNQRLTAGDLSGRLLTFAEALKAKEQEITEVWDIGEQTIAALAQQSSAQD